VQLVGGTTSGKTAFLTAFWHEYLERISQRGETGFRLFPVEAFTQLERWFRQGVTASTDETNALMYSLIREREGETPLQMTLYDVAGESFTKLDEAAQQHQFRYCEGLIVMLDPLASPEDAHASISSLISEMKKLKGIKARNMLETPAAVVISKADQFQREIGLPKIRALASRTQPLEEEPPEAVFDRVRDQTCRAFLEDHGFESVLALLESEFTVCSFFPVSAMGHEMRRGVPFEPWGVEAPMEWLLARADLEL
jgi:hypothetical protein